MLKLTHKSVVVTGAASGIGLAIANRLISLGANVVGLDLHPPQDQTFPIFQVDLTDESQLIAGIQKAYAYLGTISALINSAGVEIDEPIEALNSASIDKMYTVNVKGLMLCIREVVKHSNPDNDSLRIINLASELGFLGRQNASAYCGTKGAIISITRSLARELGQKARVNAIAPGPIDTPLINFHLMSEEQQKLECNNPLNRIGQPQEVAAMACFLLSDGANFITGQCLSVDGGAAMH